MGRKKTHRIKIIVTLLAAALLVLLCVLVSRPEQALAASEEMSSYIVYSYDITCTLNENCSLDVTEVIDISDIGQFTRTIPLDGKTKIKNARLHRATGETDGDGNAVYEEPKYSVKTEKSSVTLTSKRDDAEENVYVVTYTVANLSLTHNKQDDTLFIINVGSGWSQSINADRITLTLNLPEGFQSDKSTVFHGTWEAPDSSAQFKGTSDDKTTNALGQCAYYVDEDNPNTVVYTPLTNLKAGTGMSFWLLFDKGVLSAGVGNILPWLLLLIGLALVAAAIAIRLTVFKNRELGTFDKAIGHIKALFHSISAKIVHAQSNATEKEAADSADDATSLCVPPIPMDPITCRRVTENKIEDRDVVTLLFYWAEKGYIKISTKNENNPVFIKTADQLPSECPETWKILYGTIFNRTDRATLKSLSRYVYPQIRAVREDANGRKETGYAKKPILVGFAFALLAAMFVSFLPVFVPMQASSHAFAPVYFLTMIPAILIFVFFSAIYATRHRYGQAAEYTLTAIAGVYSVACVVLYCLFVPTGVYGMGPKIIASILTAVTEMISATFVLRSDDYSAKLKEVDGIRNFILYTPGEAIERMLADDQDLYYKFLPYALLLRIGVPWSEKFKGTTMTTPSWLSEGESKSKFSVIRENIKKTYDTVLTQLTSTPGGKTDKKKKR